MSDIEILLRELNERMDILEKKVDKLNEKIKMTINAQYGSIWGDDSTPPIPLPLRTTNEITCDPNLSGKQGNITSEKRKQSYFADGAWMNTEEIKSRNNWTVGGSSI